MNKTKHLYCRAPFDTSQWLIGLPCLSKVDFNFDFIVAVFCNLKMPFHSTAIFYSPCCIMDLNYKYKNRGHFDPSVPWLVTNLSFSQLSDYCQPRFQGRIAKGPGNEFGSFLSITHFISRQYIFFLFCKQELMCGYEIYKGTVKACFFILV